MNEMSEKLFWLFRVMSEPVACEISKNNETTPTHAIFQRTPFCCADRFHKVNNYIINYI